MSNSISIAKNKLCVLFWRVRNKADKATGKAPIYIRITVNKRKLTKGFSTGVTATEKEWNIKKHRLQGSTVLIRSDNNILDLLETKFKDIVYEFDKTNTFCSVEQVMAKYYNVSFSPLSCYDKTLADIVELWEDRLTQYIQLGEKAIRTKETYSTHHARAIAFFGAEKVLASFKVSDWEEYRLHLAQSIIKQGINAGKRTHTNTIAKYLTSFRSLFELALENEWIAKNPFHYKKAEKTRPEKVFLPYDKLQALQKLQPQQDSEIKKAIDIFLFCAYSGLSYQDYASLTNESLIKYENKDYIFLPYRYKSPLKNRYGKSYIPILPQLQSLITQYGGIDKLPKDADANRKLKFVWGAIGAPRNMALKNARHTFLNYARTILGIPTETLIMIVGHSSVKTTEESYLQRNLQTLNNDLKKLNFVL